MLFRSLRAGGFDPAYFAYYEDVDLGWRLWASGQRVLAAPRAVVHHRSGATSELLGLYRRGFLFERNAFLTVYKNVDDELWPRLMPAKVNCLHPLPFSMHQQWRIEDLPLLFSCLAFRGPLPIAGSQFQR